MVKLKHNYERHHHKPKRDSVFTIESWSCAIRDGKWEIEAYSIATGKREVVADIKTNCGFPPDAIAAFIIRAVNISAKRELLIDEMALALEICLESKDNKLTWAAEHEAEVSLRHARARTR